NDLSSKLATTKPAREECEKVVQKGLASLGAGLMATEENIWFSRTTKRDNQIANESMETSYYTGLYKGVAGPLYFLASAALAKYNIDCCRDKYVANWQFLGTNGFGAS